LGCRGVACTAENCVRTCFSLRWGAKRNGRMFIGRGERKGHVEGDETNP